MLTLPSSRPMIGMIYFHFQVSGNALLEHHVFKSLSNLVVRFPDFLGSEVNLKGNSSKAIHEDVSS